MTLSEDSFSAILSDTLSGASGDGDAYLLTPSLSQRLDLIRHLIEFSRQILLVVGEEGSGKSSLLGHLQDNAPDTWRVATLAAEPMSGAAVVIDTLAAAFGLQLDDDGDFEHRVQGILTYLQSARQAQLVPAILVDDAHLLPADALLLLLALAQPENEAANLRVVLFCDPRIERMLGSPQLQAFKRSILHTVEMPCFTEDDAAAYLARFNAGGETPNEGRVREILSHSGGIPGQIKSLAEAGLATEDNSNSSEDGSAPSRIQIRYAAAGATVALLIAAVFWAWHQSDRRLPNKAVVQPAPVTQPSVSVTPPLVQPPVTSARPAPSPAPAPQPPKAEPPPPVAATPAPSPPKPPESVAASPTPAAPPKPAEKPVPVKKPVAAKKPEVTKKPTPKPAPRTSPVHGKSWILKQPGSHYALQLFGSHDHAAAVNFAKTYKLTARSAIYSTVLGGKPLHVVIYGSYRNRAQAVAAAAHLPPQVRILKPFPRTFAAIRKLMARKP